LGICLQLKEIQNELLYFKRFAFDRATCTCEKYGDAFCWHSCKSGKSQVLSDLDTLGVINKKTRNLAIWRRE